MNAKTINHNETILVKLSRHEVEENLWPKDKHMRKGYLDSGAMFIDIIIINNEIIQANRWEGLSIAICKCNLKMKLFVHLRFVDLERIEFEWLTKLVLDISEDNACK